LIMGLMLIKWIGIIAAVIAVVIAVAIAVMPWGWLKAYAMDRASVAIGRKVTGALISVRQGGAAYCSVVCARCAH
jgi:hypothetical protein